MITLEISADNATEDFVQLLFEEVDAEEGKTVNVRRRIEAPTNLASEPLTSAALVSLGLVGASVLLRVIERWIESHRQTATLKLVIEGFGVSDEAGKHLAKIAAEHATVSISYGIAKESWAKK